MDLWRSSVMDAVVILASAISSIELDVAATTNQSVYGQWILVDAIRHLADPDRDVYPKVRHGSKKHPVTT